MPNAKYDEELVVTLLAKGEQTYAQIAKRVGITESMVGKIARGESRKDLHGRISRRIRQFRRRTCHMVASWQPNVLKKHISVGIESDGETARKCREFLLKPILDGPQMHEPDDDDGGFTLNGWDIYCQLSEQTKTKIVEELGGPVD